MLTYITTQAGKSMLSRTGIRVNSSAAVTVVWRVIAMRSRPHRRMPAPAQQYHADDEHDARERRGAHHAEPYSDEEAEEEDAAPNVDPYMGAWRTLSYDPQTSNRD